MDTSPNKKSTLEELRAALDDGSMRPVRRMIGALNPTEIGRLLESLPLDERLVVWELIEPDVEGDVLVEVAEEVRTGLIEHMEDSELVAAAAGMEFDDLADLLIDLPETVSKEVLRSLDQQDRLRLQAVLSYPEDCAGGLMNTDTISVRPDVTLEVVLRYLRLLGEMPDRTDSIFVVGRDDDYLGALMLSRLVTQDPERIVADVMDDEIPAIVVDTPEEEVTRLFENRDLVSAAVVDETNRLIGRITVDDVVDVIRDEAEHSIMSAAGLDEEDDMFAPVLTSARRRTLWLGVNLMTAFVAAYVVGQFQSAISAIVLLAVLMPVVPSMGGVAGTQSLTIITRAMALGQIEKSNAMFILRKEMAVGVINGIWWALVVTAVTTIWFGAPAVGIVVGAALMINMVTAAGAGYALPLILKRMNIDPAIAGGVVLTTITDVVGYGVFLGLGAAFLL